ncbi:30S ribosomal protein S15 [Candidatus Bathyarchaeota archaeon]|nr:MAG: 30S ribosomal protein S15 [Candidatus Bathyarchaeota archaeon]RLI31128.1 MAG: 30S ribosomal protein S15 [Candidatus Bathyarchaeota archaeon]
MGKMAYMRGRSRSTRPVSKRPPSWVVYQPEEVKALIIRLAREGKPPSVIGNELRDVYGIPLVKPIVGYGIQRVLQEAGLAPKIPEDLYNLMKKAARLRRHLERHRKDFSNKRGLQLVESKIHRLTKYYKRKGVLPPDWNYRSEIVTV